MFYCVESDKTVHSDICINDYLFNLRLVATELLSLVCILIINSPDTLYIL